MTESSAANWRPGVRRFVDVAEALSIGREGKAAQIASGKNIRQRSLAFDVKQLERPGSFSAFFHFKEQQASVR